MTLALLCLAGALWLLGPRPAPRPLVPGETPGLRHRSTRRRPRLRRRRARPPGPTDLETLLDLWAVVLGAGGTVAGAIQVAADDGPPSLRPALRSAIDARAGGASLAVALDPLADLGPSFAAPVRALVAAERDGAPLGATLQMLAAEAASAREAAAVTAARTLSVRVVVPLACCSLPAVVLGVVVPLLLTSAGDSAVP